MTSKEGEHKGQHNDSQKLRRLVATHGTGQQPQFCETLASHSLDRQIPIANPQNHGGLRSALATVSPTENTCNVGGHLATPAFHVQ